MSAMQEHDTFAGTLRLRCFEPKFGWRCHSASHVFMLSAATPICLQLVAESAFFQDRESYRSILRRIFWFFRYFLSWDHARQPYQSELSLIRTPAALGLEMEGRLLA